MMTFQSSVDFWIFMSFLVSFFQGLRGNLPSWPICKHRPCPAKAAGGIWSAWKTVEFGSFGQYLSVCLYIYIYTCRYTRKHTLKCNRQCFLYQFLVRCVLWARHMIPRAHKLRLIPSSSSFKSVCAGSYHGHCFIWLWSFRCFCDALVLPLWRWCLGRDEVVQELDETNT